MLTQIPFINYQSSSPTKILPFFQHQIKEIFLCPVLQNRLVLVGSKEDWIMLVAIVPLERLSSPSDEPQMIQIRLSVHLTPFYPNKMPGLYLFTPILPLEFQFINLLGMREGFSYSLQGLLLRFVSEIDHLGFKEWSEIVYKIPNFISDPIKDERGDLKIESQFPSVFDSNLKNMHGTYFKSKIQPEISTNYKQSKQVKFEEIEDSAAFLCLEEKNDKSNDVRLLSEIKFQDNAETKNILEIQQISQKDLCKILSAEVQGNINPAAFNNPQENIQKKEELEDSKTTTNNKKFELRNQEKKVPLENVERPAAKKRIEKIKAKRKTLKPMNKNANLPKFLIRVFTKYVDKYKTEFVKKSYDRLWAECRKLKHMKNNVFGLKSLETFFSDKTSGFLDPKANRRVISKIISNNLLTEIRYSQIPQSHQVGYLIACRVYALRCRNSNLASRIQSK